MNLKTITAAAAITAALPLAAEAAQINGQLDIVGIVNVTNSTFAPGGLVDFNPETGFVLIADGDFAPFSGVPFDLFDIDFSGPQAVYSTGGLTFTADSYFAFDDDPSDGDQGFMAAGFLTLAGFDDTPALFSFSTQENSPNQLRASFSSTTTTTLIPLPASVMMLLAGLCGLGIISRRRAS